MKSLKDEIRFLQNQVKWKEDGKEKKVGVHYSKGSYTKESGIPEGSITIYGKHYERLPLGLNPENNSDSMTDYFENDRATITPSNPYYKKVLGALKAKEKNRTKTISSPNNPRINQLAKLMEENELLGDELSGYMKDSQRRKIFRESATHRVIQRRKLTYIDQMINGLNSGGSGKLLIDDDKVYSIKGYGKKGYYLGDVEKVIKKYELGNKSLQKGVMDRATKNRQKRLLGL